MLTKAGLSRQSNKETTILEEIKLEVIASYSADGTIDIEQLNNNLKQINRLKYKEKPLNNVLPTDDENYNVIEELPAKVEVDGFNYKIKNNGNVDVKNANEVEISDIKGNEEKYYSKYITNYNSPYDEGIDTNNGQLGKWQIFFVDNDNIYIIASNYISRYYTKEKNGVGFLYSPNATDLKQEYMMSFVDYRNYNLYTSTDIPGILLNFNEKTKNNYHRWMVTKTMHGPNRCATASMIDIDLWDGYKNSTYAEYAIGGPTLEMFCKSYNQTHLTHIEEYLDTYGYKVKKDNDNPTVDIPNLNENTSLDKDMYFKAILINNSRYNGVYWLASPSGQNPYACSNMVTVNTNGLNYASYDEYFPNGFRPLVCLKNNVNLISHKDENGNITYTIEN